MFLLSNTVARDASSAYWPNCQRFAVEQGMTLRAYAERIGVRENSVPGWKRAADIAVVDATIFAALTGKVQHLSLIRAAPEETWKNWIHLFRLDKGKTC